MCLSFDACLFCHRSEDYSLSSCKPHNSRYKNWSLDVFTLDVAFLGAWGLRFRCLSVTRFAYLIRHLVFVCLPREAPSQGGVWKRHKKKFFLKKRKKPLPLWLQYLVEFGESFEPEVCWLITRSTWSYLSAWKPEVFQDLTEGLALAITLHSHYPLAHWWWEIDRWDWSCAVVELHYWVNSALWWTLYIAHAALFDWCFGLLLCFVWWFSLFWTFAALSCSARFSPNSLCRC